MIILNIVVLPAPFGPIIPTIPACGKLNSKFSYNSLSPKALETPLASITFVPKRGPFGIYISSFSSTCFWS